MSPLTQLVRQPKVKRSPRRHRDTEKFGSCDLVSGRPRTPDYGSSYPLLPLFLCVEDLWPSHNEKSCSRFCVTWRELAVEFPGRPKWVLKGDMLMLNLRTLLQALLITCVLVATAVAISAPVSNSQPTTGSDPAIRTAMQPDLSLKTVISPEPSPAALQTNLGPRHGFCRCSCGYPCTTSADCGGVSCDPFITCCEKEPGKNWFTEGAALSSHKNGEAAINIKCK